MSSDVFEIAKPFAWMALTAFLVGFASYFLFGERPQTLAGDGWVQPAAASGPSSADWNIVKHI
ncbi:hypothetical protein [Phenylobacterium sp. J367]|uniref:hypothetical protein n=1 Tax=Phenylobacterium sp. J367 TaxID=2898435 RepID=UPI00215122E8|nr:hypothetical protein [Phenylobacterium sp. J367]MCR5877802.1 hypothetical protein [Phenylobacterium sp. J367]